MYSIGEKVKIGKAKSLQDIRELLEDSLSEFNPEEAKIISKQMIKAIAGQEGTVTGILLDDECKQCCVDYNSSDCDDKKYVYIVTLTDSDEEKYDFLLKDSQLCKESDIQPKYKIGDIVELKNPKKIKGLSAIDFMLLMETYEDGIFMIDDFDIINGEVHYLIEDMLIKEKNIKQKVEL